MKKVMGKYLLSLGATVLMSVAPLVAADPTVIPTNNFFEECFRRFAIDGVMSPKCKDELPADFHVLGSYELEINSTLESPNIDYPAGAATVSFNVDQSKVMYTAPQIPNRVVLTTRKDTSVSGVLPVALNPENPTYAIYFENYPERGSVQLADDVATTGAFTYVPAPGADNYTTSFSYSLVGAKGGMTRGVVIVNVGASLPSLIDDISVDMEYGKSVPIRLPFPASKVVSVSNPWYGFLTLQPSAKAVTYSPNEGSKYWGQEVCLLRVNNGAFVQDVRIVINISAPTLVETRFQIFDPEENIRLDQIIPAHYGLSSLGLNSKDRTIFHVDGVFRVVLNGIDQAGVHASGVVNFRVDNTPPTCTWLQPTSEAFVRENIEGIVTAADNMSGVQGVDFVHPVDNRHTPFVRITATPQWLYSSYDTRAKEGRTTLTALVYDVAGNPGTCTDVVVVDNDAPTGAITLLPAPVEYQGVSLVRGMVLATASGIDLGSGLASASLSIDDTKLVSVKGSVAADVVNTAARADGSHVFSAVFADRTGQLGSVSRSVVLDNAAPVVTITAPLNSERVSRALSTINANIVEANGISEKKVLIDDVEVPFSESNGVLTLEAPVTASGMHTLKIIAKDTVGNSAEDTHHFVVVGGQSDDLPSRGITLDFNIVGIDNGTVLPGNTLTTLTLSAKGGDGSIAIQAQMDGNNLRVVTVPETDGTFTFDIDSSKLSDGSHTISVTVSDSVGATLSRTVTVVIDNTAPSLLVTSPKEAETLSGVIALGGMGTDNSGSGVASMAVFLDGQFLSNAVGSGSSVNVSYSLDTAQLQNGDHSVEFRATDAAGNMEALARRVKIQNGPSNLSVPVISNVIYPTEAMSLSGAFYASWIVTGSPTSVGVRIDGGSPLSAQDMGDGRYQALINTTLFQEGFHTLEFVAANGSGSVSRTVRVYFDKTAPTVNILTPNSGAPLALVRTLLAEASDGSRGLENVRFLLNGTTDLAFFPGNTDTTKKEYAYQWDTEGVADGPYTLTVVAKDQSGLITQKTVAFTVDNANIPLSEAAVQFLYSNAVASQQSGPFLVGPLTAVTAKITNATLDPGAVNSGSLRVLVTKDGEVKKLMTGSVRVNGNSIEWLGTIPANARVYCVLSVLDSQGKVIRRTEEIISAMSPELGGTVLAAADGMLQLNVPGGALLAPALVTAEQMPSTAPEFIDAQAPTAQLSQLEVVYGPFRISALGADGEMTRFKTAATLVFQRSAQQMTPLDAGRVDRAERYDVERRIWSSLDNRAASLAGLSQVPQSRTISASVVTLGIYRISAIPQPGDGVTELIAYPSPLRAGSENATIAYLMGDNADVDLVIYDVLGNVVRHFEFAAGSKGGSQLNEILWDGRNGEGDLVANGAYIVQVTSAGHRARTKIGVAK